MTSIVSFKKSLIQTLGDYKELAEKISGVYLGNIEEINLPLVRFGPLVVEDWSSYSSLGKVFNVTFEVFSNKPSSKECVEIMDLVSDYIPLLKSITEDFVITKTKILASKLNFVKSERLWCGEIKAKFWVETIH